MRIRGTAYPVLLPTLRDPRLHLAGVIVTLQVLGQTTFDFDLSIAQILVSLLTCATLEVAIAFRRQRVLMWPASASQTDIGPHQNGSGSARSGPRKTKQSTSPKLDGLKMCRPRKVMTYFERSAIAAVPA